MILLIGFATIALLPFIIAGCVYAFRYLRYLVNTNKASKIKEQAILNYDEFRKTLKEELSQFQMNEKSGGRHAYNFIYENVADRFGVLCSMNWYSTHCNIESKSDYIERKLREAQIAKPTEFFGDEDSEVKSGLTVAAWCIGGLGLFVTCLCAGISHIPSVVNKKEIEISENYYELKQNKITLEKNKEQYQQIEWNKLVISHNENTKNFYIDIQKHQISAKNPWINWFVNPAWSKFDINEIKKDCTITVTNGELTSSVSYIE